MPNFPYTHLILGDQKALAVAGYDFHVLNAHSGEVIHSTARLDAGVRDRLNKSGAIRCAAVDSTFTHVIVAGDDKRLKVWAVGDELKLLSDRELPKRPTKIGFTHEGRTIIVSDKFGDVFSYPLHPDPTPISSTSQTGASRRGSLTSHENPSNGTLILGHASMLTTYLLTSDEKFIITADRDEHIRVSWFPKGYVIERYCLGHEKFVSALHIPSFRPSALISGGGDPMLKLWDWMSGTLLSEVSVFDAVEPYIKVKAPRWRRGWNEGDGGDEEAAEGRSKGKDKGRRRGKDKAGGEESRAQGNVEQREDQSEPTQTAAKSADVEMAESGAQTPPTPQAVNGSSEEDRLIFVVHRLATVDRAEHGRHILFNAVGATAVFYAPYPVDGERLPSSVVQAVDLGKPVIDFTVDSNGNVWTFLDMEWGTSHSPLSENVQSIRLLSWQNATLSELAGDHPTLLKTLNSQCIVPASPADLKALDLYSALSSLPKNVDPEHDPLIRDTLSEAAAASLDGEGKQLTQRELGRLRKKKALLAKIQEQERQKRFSREGTCTGTEGEAETEREVKRARSESAGDDRFVPEPSGAGGTTSTGAGDLVDVETRDMEMDAS
ncbi:WD40-repeat-containing domain protein [Trametes punicea]|nr:WD40-repeat-containing domain protein [Trametes punicea]